MVREFIRAILRGLSGAIRKRARADIPRRSYGAVMVALQGVTWSERSEGQQYKH